jgi:hypothetical protein
MNYGAINSSGYSTGDDPLSRAINDGDISIVSD